MGSAGDTPERSPASSEDRMLTHNRVRVVLATVLALALHARALATVLAGTGGGNFPG